MGKIIVIKWVKELGFNCLMGVINIVSGRFFSFFSMTRFLACANVLRLDEYDFLYLPLCKRKLDFLKRRQVISTFNQRYTYRVLQTIQMKLIFLCLWAEPAVLGSAKIALKFKYEKIG